MRSLERALAAPVFTDAAQRAHRHNVAVLAYHGVSDAAAFSRQLDAIADMVTFIGPDDLRAAFAGTDLPDHPALVTFDDGERSVLEHGLGPLTDAAIPAIMFVCGGLLDGTTPYWWDEVEAYSPRGYAEVRRLWRVPDRERRREIERLRSHATKGPVPAAHLTAEELRTLIAARIEVGNHTWDHPWLDHCESDEVERQVVLGHQALVDRGVTPRAFAYPFGNVDPRAEPLLDELGYDLAFAYDARHARVHEHRLRISRLQLDTSDPPERARLVVAGIHGTAKRLLRRV
jgi:peptidoglycan/xylan/chitin deacetylase (PgdA/CDA1 family)